MIDILGSYYLWIKALHVIAVIAWRAAMLYLPRLFVYHADAPQGGELSKTLKIMEYRLAKFIMTPAMIATWIFGLLMLWVNFEPLMTGQGWMHAKLLLVVLMTGLHGVFSKWRKNFANDANTKPATFYRIWNEAPTLLMILIVIFAIAEPF